MSLRALRTLLAVARHGSFVRAAEAVHLTQSAVSLHIRALEEAFNASLFDRSRRIPVLTEAGHFAVERAREIVALYDSIAADLGEGSELRGRLRIGAIQTALAGVLPSALAALTYQHPHIRFNVASGMSAELAMKIETGELDVAVTTEPVKPYPHGLVSTPLYRERFWLIAPAGVTSDDPQQLLLEYPFIRFDRKAWAGRTIERELRRSRLRVRTTMELDSQEAIVKMVSSGLGVAVIPIAEDKLSMTEQLIRIPFGEPQKTRLVVLLEREDRPAGRLAQAVVSAIREQAGPAATHEK